MQLLHLVALFVLAAVPRLPPVSILPFPELSVSHGSAPQNASPRRAAKPTFRGKVKCRNVSPPSASQLQGVDISHVSRDCAAEHGLCFGGVMQEAKAINQVKPNMVGWVVVWHPPCEKHDVNFTLRLQWNAYNSKKKQKKTLYSCYEKARPSVSDTRNSLESHWQ